MTTTRKTRKVPVTTRLPADLQPQGSPVPCGSEKAPEPHEPAVLAGLAPEDPLARLTEHEIGRVLGLPARPNLSEHLDLEIANALYRRHSPGDPPPLAPGDPVPGCWCPQCTGAEADRPRRRRRGRRLPRLPIDEARSCGILTIAERLRLGDPERRGEEWAVRCPFHDDRTPSLYLNPVSNLWYCFACAEGGDGIALWMEATGCSFPEAVRELASW